MVQSAEAVEFTDCISAEGKDYSNDCPGYDTKPSDGEALVMLSFEECGVPLRCHHSLVVLDRVLS